MADKKIKVSVDVDSNLEPTIANLKELKRQLKQTAAGSEEFKKLFGQIDDLEDKIKGAKGASSDWIDTLESAGGPIGMLGAALNKAKVATTSFGAALKATGIGLIVAAVGGLVAAFAKQEGAMKKLQPLLIGLEKILGGIFKAFEPLLDAFLELANQALPYITKGIGTFYSGLYSLFTLIKDVGLSAGKILKGIFTLDFDALKEGAAGIKDAFGNVSKTFDETYKRFEEGTKDQTKTEKENAEERKKIADDLAKKKADLDAKAKEAAQKAFDEKLKRMEAEDKLDEASLRKLKEEALLIATTEQEKLDTEKKFAELAYQQRLKDVQDKQALYAIDSIEYKNLQAEKINEEANYIAQLTGFKDKQKQITDEANKTLLEKQKKQAEDERGIVLSKLQSHFEDLDRENQLNDADFELDLERFAAQREILAEQERVELLNTELTEFQKTEIAKKYSDLRKGITQQEVDTEKAARDAKVAIQLEYIKLFEQFGSLLSQIAGKNKAIAIAGLLIEKGAAVARIVTQMMSVPAILPPGIPNPAYIPARIGGALSIAATLAATVQGIQQINQAASQAGISGGGGGSVGGTTVPAPVPPRIGTTTAPQIQTGQGMNATQQIGETLNRAQTPLRAYVVSGEISSQQSLDRRTSRAATFSGG